MSDKCQTARAALFGLAGDLESRDRAAPHAAPHAASPAVHADELLARHLGECTDCSALLRRLEAQRHALQELPPLSAPRELEGRVVAVFQGGFRQDRAARVLASLRPVPAPDDLTERLEGTEVPGRPALHRALGAGVRVPSVLERLVAEEIADPARTRTRRSMDLLERRPAPASLDRRIARLLSPLGRLRRLARPAAGVAAAALVLFLVIPVLRPGSQPEPRAYSFRVVRVGSAQELDPQARRMLDGVTGGALFLNGGPR